MFLGRLRCAALFRSSVCLAARDAYSVMGLERSASPQEVKARFRVLAKQYHPEPRHIEQMAVGDGVRMGRVQLALSRRVKAIFATDGF